MGRRLRAAAARALAFGGEEAQGAHSRQATRRARAMDAAKNATEGTIILVGDMVQQAIEREIFSYLQHRWILERIDGGHSVVAYRLKEKN